MLIDTLQRIAVRMQPIRFWLLLLSGFFLVVLIYVALGSSSQSGDHFLVPAIIGLLWSLSGYAFILNFRSVPTWKLEAGGFFRRQKLRLLRFWYWILALFFFSTTLALLVLSIRLLRIWLKDYGN
jgi:hypothetical protein